jgi:hypothetical protein
LEVQIYSEYQKCYLEEVKKEVGRREEGQKIKDLLWEIQKIILIHFEFFQDFWKARNYFLLLLKENMHIALKKFYLKFSKKINPLIEEREFDFRKFNTEVRERMGGNKIGKREVKMIVNFLTQQSNFLSEAEFLSFFCQRYYLLKPAKKLKKKSRNVLKSLKKKRSFTPPPSLSQSRLLQSSFILYTPKHLKTRKKKFIRVNKSCSRAPTLKSNQNSLMFFSLKIFPL